ncbi:hypothetical protein [Candidatus Contendibacter odensensis]|uniref:Terminase n=1 Tax=Candidatus Contendobacter odensis Run_B_J11 TaxID=1400861 RepID=A0A7U7J5V9_9GAMM|nr:hypothetical protein [Candidatus Contendobacter odensis]CDH46958.1 hypothetical protein BN874_690008 [Candidatus Contendobacter odensis Run_B_J11]
MTAIRTAPTAAPRKKKKPDWAKIRAGYETGGTLRGLSEKYGVAWQTIQHRKDKEDWSQDFKEVILRKAEEQLAGLSVNDDADKRAAAIAEEAAKKATVLARHRNEWNAVRKLAYEAIQDGKHDFEKAKLAKITSETLQIVQHNERKAWGLNDPAPVATDTAGVDRQQTAMVAINNLLASIVLVKHEQGTTDSDDAR